LPAAFLISAFARMDAAKGRQMSESDHREKSMDDISLRKFTEMNEAADAPAYVHVLEAFDRIEQLQELKTIARHRSGILQGSSILDVGCGFALETLRLASMIGPGGKVAGIDKSADFIAEARKRASSEGLQIDLRVGDAETLPYADSSFDYVRAERLLIYLEDPAQAVREMKRVAKPGGRTAIIEPDFSTTTINLSDRPAVRRALAHEVDTAVVMSWLPGPLRGILDDVGLRDIRTDTRVLIFPQDLAATYFSSIGNHAAAVGVLTPGELDSWLNGITDLKASGRLFGTIGYFLFTARV
jgi:ubiquinone/menaquinone biosynthesis C-methylase UbiE